MIAITLVVEIAANRPVGAQWSEHNGEWVLQRHNMPLETLAEVGDNSAVGLSAVAVRLAIQSDRSP